MCDQHFTGVSSKYTKPALYSFVIIAAILSGLSDFQFLHELGTNIAEIFMRLFKAISLPMISLSLIVTLCENRADDDHKILWKKAIFYTSLTTILASFIAMLLYVLIQPENVSKFHDTIEKSIETQNVYFSHLIKLVPDNILAPFIEHQVMGVLFIGIVIGLAIRYIPEERPRETVANFFIGLHSILIKITSWIVAVIPLALYGFITTTVIGLKGEMEIEGLSKYLLIILLANLIQGFIVLPALLKLHNIKPYETMRKMLPALSVAFLTKSSSGTLPVTIETAEKNLGIKAKVSRFILPLCTTINMNGCAAFIFVTVIFLMQNNGIEITWTTMLSWVFISTIAAIGNAGVPMGCFFLSASLLAGMNVPINLLGIILPFYTIIDMVETSLNVWSDSAVVSIVDKKMQ